MNIYQQKYYWKIGLLVFAIIIVLASLVYNYKLARALAKEERNKIELYAKTLEEINNPTGDNFLLNILRSNTTIPVIEVFFESGKFKAYNNLKIENAETKEDTLYIYEELESMKAGYPPIESIITAEKKNLVYYKDSTLLTRLKWYPYIQLLLIGSFLMIAYFAFSAARRAEQNQVWVGMARETAHQLGTPLSSLVAWIDMLEMSEDQQVQQVGQEMEKDTARLELIADRFSKIGSKPKLEENNLNASLLKTLNYVKRRASKKIEFSNNLKTSETIITRFSPPLLDWVVENLLKNALDAMEGVGAIGMQITTGDKNIIIEVSDTGSGIPKSKFKDVFKPGYSSKKRGWGLGLSLSKRIIENYHQGKIFVHQSSTKNPSGTTFRIVLPT